MTANPRTIYLKDYQPFTHVISAVSLVFTLAPTATRVVAELQMSPNPARPGRHSHRVAACRNHPVCACANDAGAGRLGFSVCRPIFGRIVDLVTIVPLLLLGVVFYMLVLRPQKAKQKAQAQMIAAVGPGAAVMTTAGVFGTVVSTTDDELRLEIAPGVVIRMVPAAIAKVIPVEDPDDDTGDGPADLSTPDSLDDSAK